MPIPLSEQKHRIRLEALRRREGKPEAERARASRAITAALDRLPLVAEAQALAGFWPIRSEVDIRPSLEKWSAVGRTVALPVVSADGLIFRRWSPGCRMRTAGFGLLEPDVGNDEVFPDVLMVPLAAFDRSGGRLGYGKGYYDRAIAALKQRHKLMTIGVAFAIQEVAAIPREPHDQPLDVIVTEAELVDAQG